MHILFLTDNFPPEGNAPASRTYEHGVRWVKAGCQVTVITGAPNFPEGKVYSGYKNSWYSREEIDGIQVIRVKTYITANEGFVKRILDYMSFMIASFFVGLFIKKIDVIVATSPQFFTAISGWLLSVLKWKPFVFELRDIWPASIAAVGAMRRSIIIRIFEKIEIFLYQRADLIVSVTHSFKKELVSRGVAGEKIAVVRNGVALSLYQPKQKNPDLSKELDLNNKFVVGYLGTHGMAHALDSVLDCAEMMLTCHDIIFLFVGGGAYKSELNATVSQRSLSNVISLSRQEKHTMPDYWSLVDISLISLKDAELFKTVIPSKIFESMGMGKAMIFSGPEGEASEIILESDSGVIVEPENPEALKNAILDFYGDKQRFFDKQASSLQSAKAFSRDIMADNMLSAMGVLVK